MRVVILIILNEYKTGMANCKNFQQEMRNIKIRIRRINDPKIVLPN